MSFSDPQTVTINAVAKSMPRVETGGTASTYRTADEIFQMKISHQSSKSRVRRMVRIDQTVIAENPLTAVNSSQKLGVYLVVDEPTFGFTDADIDYVVDGLVAWLTPANIAKFLGSES